MAQTTHLAAQRREASATPERSAEAIRQDIAAKRDSISETVDKLGERIQELIRSHRSALLPLRGARRHGGRHFMAPRKTARGVSRSAIA